MRVTELPRPEGHPRHWQVDNGDRHIVADLPMGLLCTCDVPECKHKAEVERAK